MTINNNKIPKNQQYLMESMILILLYRELT